MTMKKTLTIIGLAALAVAGIVQAQGGTNTVLTLQWTNGANTQSNVVERSIANTNSFVVIATVAAPAITNSFTDTTVTLGQMHYYRVKGRNAAGDSAGYSNIAGGLALTTPGSPTIITINASVQ